MGDNELAKPSTLIRDYLLFSELSKRLEGPAVLRKLPDDLRVLPSCQPSPGDGVPLTHSPAGGGQWYRHTRGDHPATSGRLFAPERLLGSADKTRFSSLSVEESCDGPLQ